MSAAPAGVVVPRSPVLWQPPFWLGLLWGFAESTFFFIIPDLLLSWASLSGIRKGLRILAAIVLGSLVGGVLVYVWASRHPELARAAVASIPFVRPYMLEAVATGYRDHGVLAMLYGPASGIPYKVYAVLAPPDCDILTFAVVSLPARLERLALSWLAFAAAGLVFKSWIGLHPRLTRTLFVVFWVGVYVLYWARL